MKFWLLAIFPLLLSASVNEPLRCEFFSGYKNDRIHWHLQLPGEGGVLTYSELYRDLEFWENGLSLKAIHRDIVFFLRGSYSAFGRGGTLFQKYADLPFTPDQPQFRFHPEGWAADASGYFGYAVNLTADRTYKVILIPLLGYSAHFERLRSKGGTPDPYESSDALGADFYTMRSSLPQQLHQTWYGFFLGGAFQVEPGGRFVLQAGYAYHFLRCRFKSHDETDVSLYNSGPVLVSNDVALTKVKTSEGGNMGQTGWVQLDYLFSKLWRMGLGGQIHYFSSRVIDASLQSAGETSSEKFKLRWTSIAGWVQVSREI